MDLCSRSRCSGVKAIGLSSSGGSTGVTVSRLVRPGPAGPAPERSTANNRPFTVRSEAVRRPRTTRLAQTRAEKGPGQSDVFGTVAGWVTSWGLLVVSLGDL